MNNKAISRIGKVIILVTVVLINFLAGFYYNTTKSNGDSEQAVYEEERYSAIASNSLEGTGLETFSVSESEYLEALHLSVNDTSYSIEQLKQMFPAGRYWNRGNLTGTTSSPCNHSQGIQNCNAYGGFCYQCIGFALQMASMNSGKNPLYSYKCYSGANAVNNIVPGSVVRFNVNSWTDHAIFVTGVSGDTIYYSDCNWDNKCGIRHNASYSKAELSSLLSKNLIQRWDYADQHSAVGFVLSVNSNLRNIASCQITVTGPDVLKNETDVAITIMDQGKKLSRNDYAYYVCSKDRLGGEVEISGKGDYEGVIVVRYDNIMCDLIDCKFEYKRVSPYSPFGVNPEVTVINKYGEKVPSYEYDVIYDESYLPGKKMMTVVAHDDSSKYIGGMLLSYEMLKADVDSEDIYISVSSTAELIEGKAEPTISVRDSVTGELMQEGMDYAVEYFNNTKKGEEGYVHIIGIGRRCMGEKKVAFKVVTRNDIKIH